MPNINLYDIYNRKRVKFGINDSTNFRQYFLDALNIVYSELNEKVFEAATLEPLGSFDDIIDIRIVGFTDMTFDVGSDSAIEGRDFWSVEYDFERISATNGFIDTIADDASNVVISITNGVVSVAGDSVACSASIPNVANESVKLSFVSDKDGNRIIVNDSKLSATYTTGTEETSQPIGTVSSHVVSGVSGLDFLRMRFLSSGTLIYDFLLNKESLKAGDTNIITDQIASYEVTVLPDPPIFETRYIEPSTGLDFRYRSALELGLDYHLQDGGQFGLEPEPERERKWYGRGIRSARATFSQQSTYVSPLNI